MPHQDLHQRDERWELASRAAQEGIWDWLHIPVHPANVPTLSGQSFR